MPSLVGTKFFRTNPSGAGVLLPSGFFFDFINFSIFLLYRWSTSLLMISRRFLKLYCTHDAKERKGRKGRRGYIEMFNGEIGEKCIMKSLVE